MILNSYLPKHFSQLDFHIELQEIVSVGMKLGWRKLPMSPDCRACVRPHSGAPYFGIQLYIRAVQLKAPPPLSASARAHPLGSEPIGPRAWAWACWGSSSPGCGTGPGRARLRMIVSRPQAEPE